MEFYKYFSIYLLVFVIINFSSVCQLLGNESFPTSDLHPASIEPPGNLALSETPQFILITFDDAINSFSEGFVTAALDSIKNPDGEPAPRTYFVSREYTDPNLAIALFEKGHELANHTTTHTTGYRTSVAAWYDELETMNRYLVNEIGIPSNQISGFRAPHLATNDSLWQVLQEMGFLYDSSLPEKVISPPIISQGLDRYVWPHTLDFGAKLYCLANRCPSDPVPGLWTIPMWTWEDTLGFDYGPMDPAVVSDSIFIALLNMNLKKRYNGNRCPLGIYMHAGQMWKQSRQKILKRFLEEKLQLPGVWMITMRGLIEWMRDPVPISGMAEWMANGGPRGLLRTNVSLPKKPTLSYPENHGSGYSQDERLLWDVQLTASAYHIQLSENLDFSDPVIDEQNKLAAFYSMYNLNDGTKYYWRVRSQNSAGDGAWSEPWQFTMGRINSIKTAQLITDFNLEQNFPNPFNPSTKISFFVPAPTNVSLKIYDNLGRDVETLVSGYFSPGSKTVVWKADNYSAGIYYYKLTAGSFTDIKKLVLIK